MNLSSLVVFMCILFAACIIGHLRKKFSNDRMFLRRRHYSLVEKIQIVRELEDDKLKLSMWKKAHPFGPTNGIEKEELETLTYNFCGTKILFLDAYDMSMFADESMDELLEDLN